MLPDEHGFAWLPWLCKDAICICLSTQFKRELLVSRLVMACLDQDLDAGCLAKDIWKLSYPAFPLLFPLRGKTIVLAAESWNGEQAGPI